MKIKLFICLVLLGAGAGCETDSPLSTGANPPPGPLNTNSRPSPNQTVATADYLLAPEDLLDIKIYGEDALTQEVRISQDSTISLLLIKSVNLTGMTLHQAETEIRERYDRFLINPQVNVIVKDYAKRTVNVLGHVSHPGQVPFPLEKGLTLVDAITAAGGLDGVGDDTNVKVTRTLADGSQEKHIINLKKLINNSNSNQSADNKDFPLMINDVIYVDQYIFIPGH